MAERSREPRGEKQDLYGGIALLTLSLLAIAYLWAFASLPRTINILFSIVFIILAIGGLGGVKVYYEGESSLKREPEEDWPIEIEEED